MTLKFDGWPKLWASFSIHRWIQTGVTVWKCSIWVKTNDSLSRVTSKFGGWPWKSIGHLFYAVSSFAHHFIVITVLKWSYSPETLNLGQHWWFFLSHVTFKFEGWPWKTTGHLLYNTLSFAYHYKAIDEFKLELRVQKRSIRVKISDFFVPRDLEIWWMTWQTIGHFFYAALSFMYHFIAISVFKLEL